MTADLIKRYANDTAALLSFAQGCEEEADWAENVMAANARTDAAREDWLQVARDARASAAELRAAC